MMSPESGGSLFPLPGSVEFNAEIREKCFRPCNCIAKGLIIQVLQL